MSYSYKRCLQLLTLLSREKSFKPIHYYAQAMHLSPKSLGNDIKQLTILMQDQAQLLQKEPGKGIRLIKPFRFELKHLLQATLPAHRQVKILHYLIKHRHYPSVNTLCQQFNVSKSSIVLDLKTIKHKLAIKIPETQQPCPLTQRLALHIIFIESLHALLPENLHIDYLDILKELSDYYPKALLQQTLHLFYQLTYQYQHDGDHPDFHALFIILLALLYEQQTSSQELAAARDPYHFLQELINQQLISSRFKPLSLVLASPSEQQSLAKLLLQTFAPHQQTNQDFIRLLSQEYHLCLFQQEVIHLFTENVIQPSDYYGQLISIGLLLIEYHYRQYQRQYHPIATLSILFRLIILIQQSALPQPVYLCSNLKQPYHQLLTTRLTKILPSTYYLLSLSHVKDLYPHLKQTHLYPPLILATHALNKIPYLPISSLPSIQEDLALLNACAQRSERWIFYNAAQPTHTYSIIKNLLNPSLSTTLHKASSCKHIFQHINTILQQHNYITTTLIHHLDYYLRTLPNILPQGWLIIPLDPATVTTSTMFSISCPITPIRWQQQDIHLIIVIALTSADAHLMPPLYRELYELMFIPDHWQTIFSNNNEQYS